MNDPAVSVINQDVKITVSGSDDKPLSSPTASFGRYYLSILTQPRRGFNRLVSDPHRLRYGLLAFSIPAIGYTLFYILATIAGGAPSVFEPWLAIPKELYFQYDRFILAPSMLMGWILAAGVVQLLSHFFGGKGSFEDTLSVLGFGISLATWSTLIHELADAILSVAGLINMQAYELILNEPTFWSYLYKGMMALYIGGFLVFFTKGVGAAQGLRRGPAILLGVVGLVIYQGVFFIFNR